jgi:hypothetical protein
VICLEQPADTCFAAAGLIALSEGAVSDLSTYAERLVALGLPRARVGGVVRALAPYAASIGRAGEAAAVLESRSNEPSGKPSFWKRLLG